MNPDDSESKGTSSQRAASPWSVVGSQVVLVSFLVLFVELMLIRWVATQVQVAAYFPNLILIAAFLGLGVGALRSDLPFRWWSWMAWLTGLTLVTVGLGRIAFTAEGLSEHLWLLYRDLPENAPVIEGVRWPLVLLFVSATIAFVPLGHFLGVRLERFREGPGALVGYSLDLGGSFLGVVAFAALGVSGLPPVVWFLVALGIGGVLFAGLRPKRWLVYGVFAIALLILVRGTQRGGFYSPYYALSVVPIEDEGAEGEHEIWTNGSLHQVALRLRMETYDEQLRGLARQGYTMPYTLLDREPEKILILGSGSGNDVAVALDTAADTIHAVEIDPVIRSFGDRFHPDLPYQDPRVESFVTDGRRYLNQTDETYDLIVFGTLDSQTQLSALSSVRLDNFVYSVDGLREARERLRPGGGLVMYFLVGDPYIQDHLTVMLTKAFGEIPVMLRGGWGLFNTIFLAGPAFDHIPVSPERERLGREIVESDPVTPNDDWPYLYLPQPGVTRFYWSMIAVLGVLSLVLVLGASRGLREDLLTRRTVDWEMLLYGMGFLLMETRLVTAMNLGWGATWITSALVFGSVLLMLLACTVVMQLKPMPFLFACVGLIGSLFVTYLVPPAVFSGMDLGLRLLSSALYVGVPIFFAAALFAIRFDARQNASVAFGWNLLGAVLGGLMEFFAMSLGLRAMILVAIAVYLVAMLIRLREPLLQEEAVAEAVARA